MTSAPRERSGACAGIMTTSRLVGQAIGGIVVTIVFSLFLASGGGVEVASMWAFSAAALFGLLAVAVSAVRLAR